MNQKTSLPQDGSTETSALTQLTEAEKELAQLLEIEQAVLSIAVKLSPIIDRVMRKTLPMG